MSERNRARFAVGGGAALLLAIASAGAQEVGAPPPASLTPRAEFAFEFRVNLLPPVVVGETPFGRRQYIPIAGGPIAGPKFNGEVLPGGWDYQLAMGNGCSWLSADYFIRARDGTVIHVLNEGPNCSVAGERSLFRPRFEAPKGTYDWMTRGSFVATLEVERAESAPGAPPAPPRAIRLKIYQLK